MKSFIYRKVDDLKDALLLLSENGEKARALAGGTGLLVAMKEGAANPEVLVDIKGVPGLDEIQYAPGEGLTLGALLLIRSIETAPLIREKFSVLFDAARLLGSIQIRNRATLGGNLCSAFPSTEMAPGLISLGSMAKVSGRQGDRWVLLEDLFAGPGKTVLRPDELLTLIRVLEAPPQTGGAYLKHTLRKAMDRAIVSVAVCLTLNPSLKKCEEIKIVLGAVAPTPMRARRAEDRLRGQRVDEGAIQEASMAAAEESRPVTDIRGSAEYRREMTSVLTAKAIHKALERAHVKEING